MGIGRKERNRVHDIWAQSAHYMLGVESLAFVDEAISCWRRKDEHPMMEIPLRRTITPKVVHPPHGSKSIIHPVQTWRPLGLYGLAGDRFPR